MHDELVPEEETVEDATLLAEDEQLAVEGSDEGDSVVAPEGRVVIEKNDRSLAELHRWYKNGRLVLDPDWQREYVWDRRRASKLIESVLVDIPVPVVYLAKSSSGHYEVIDGLQRLSSVFNFFDGQLALSSLDMRSDLNGMRFSQLGQPDKNKLEDATFRTFELV